MTDIATRPLPPVMLRFRDVVPGWRWKCHDGRQMRPDEMHTKHLFFTLRMIWNHRMPMHMHVGGDTKRWNLNRPDRELRTAIVLIGAELFARDDLPKWMRRQLDEMAAWLHGATSERFIEDARTIALLTHQGD